MDKETSFDLGIARTLRSVDVSDFCGWSAHAHWCEWNHKYETATSFLSQINSCMRANWPRFIRPGSIVIDIGAHSGDTTIPMSLFAYDKATRTPGTVIAVEPNPDVFAILEINLALNSHLSRFIPIQAAVTPPGVSEIEIADFGTANCNMGIISNHFSDPLKDRLDEVTLNKFKVKGMSLSEIIRTYVPSERVSDIDFIKIDCEGYDKEILLSSREVLMVIRPAIYVEWFRLFSAVESQDLFRAVENIGYVALDPADLLEASVDRYISDLMLVPREKMNKF